jgi:hypothetical protein
VVSKRFLQLANTGVPGKPDFGLLGWEQDPRDLLLLQLGQSRFLRRYSRAGESARS